MLAQENLTKEENCSRMRPGIPPVPPLGILKEVVWGLPALEWLLPVPSSLALLKHKDFICI